MKYICDNCGAEIVTNNELNKKCPLCECDTLKSFKEDVKEKNSGIEHIHDFKLIDTNYEPTEDMVSTYVDIEYVFACSCGAVKYKNGGRKRTGSYD